MDRTAALAGTDKDETAPEVAQAFVAHRGELVRFLARRLRSFATASDLAQETYLRARRLGSTPVANPRALLFEIAANLATDHGRVETRRAELLQEAHDILWSGTDEFSPERQLLAKDALAAVTAALTHLPERSRLVFYLNRFDGLAQREIAAKLGISRTNVEKHMRRALACVAAAREKGGL